jgi:hypothetical protein
MGQAKRRFRSSLHSSRAFQPRRRARESAKARCAVLCELRHLGRWPAGPVTPVRVPSFGDIVEQRVAARADSRKLEGRLLACR